MNSAHDLFHEVKLLYKTFLSEWEGNEQDNTINDLSANADDSITRVWPNFKVPAKLKQLLSHSWV